MQTLIQRLTRMSHRLLPESLHERGWGNLWGLFYLGFLFMNWNADSLGLWLPMTLLSVALFVPLYFHALRLGGRTVFGYAAVIALLGFALLPLNTSANTYLIYAATLLPLTGISLRRAIALIFAGLALLATQTLLLGWPHRFVLIEVGITAIVAIAICAAHHHEREKNLRQAELKLSHDEVRRLGALAERERIGRDLHDLLGHTLSLITLKSELAVKLFDRDPAAARREMADVERVARDALGQVRRAVSGIRTAGLAAELASARLLLESCDMRLDYRLAADALPADVETVLALSVREAITNIQRHAGATHARVDLSVSDGEARLAIADDGRGGVITPGNGLTGMRERLQTLGGRLEIGSGGKGGLRLLVVLPMPAALAPPALAATWPDAAASVQG